MKNSITIIDLAKVVKFEDVQKALKFHYPDDKSNYERLYVEIRKLRKNRKDYKNERITITNRKNYNLSLDSLYKYDDYYDISVNRRHSMSFRPWRELLNMPISEDTLMHYTFRDILAHFIYEITFYGSEKEAKIMLQNLIQDSQEINKKNKLK